MFDAAGFITPTGIFALAGVRMVAWTLVLWATLLLLGKNPRMMLDEITLPEAVFFGLFALATAYLVVGSFSG